MPLFLTNGKRFFVRFLLFDGFPECRCDGFPADGHAGDGRRARSEGEDDDGDGQEDSPGEGDDHLVREEGEFQGEGQAGEQAALFTRLDFGFGQFLRQWT